MAAFRELRTLLGLRKDRPGKHVHIGRHSYGLTGSTVFQARADATVSIGAFCSIAAGVRILVAGEHQTDHASTYPLRKILLSQSSEPGSSKGGVTIGNDVWIGASAIILSGLCIGDGAVIGAGAVVSKSVAPYAIVAGNPARQIRCRFEPPIVESLLRIAWWEWPDDKIRAEIDWFYGPIEAFVARHDEASKRP